MSLLRMLRALLVISLLLLNAASAKDEDDWLFAYVEGSDTLIYSCESFIETFGTMDTCGSSLNRVITLSPLCVPKTFRDCVYELQEFAMSSFGKYEDVTLYTPGDTIDFGDYNKNIVMQSYINRQPNSYLCAIGSLYVVDKGIMSTFDETPTIKNVEVDLIYNEPPNSKIHSAEIINNVMNLFSDIIIVDVVDLSVHTSFGKFQEITEPLSITIPNSLRYIRLFIHDEVTTSNFNELSKLDYFDLLHYNGDVFSVGRSTTESEFVQAWVNYIYDTGRAPKNLYWNFGKYNKLKISKYLPLGTKTRALKLAGDLEIDYTSNTPVPKSFRAIGKNQYVHEYLEELTLIGENLEYGKLNFSTDVFPNVRLVELINNSQNYGNNDATALLQDVANSMVNNEEYYIDLRGFATSQFPTFNENAIANSYVKLVGKFPPFDLSEQTPEFCDSSCHFENHVDFRNLVCSKPVVNSPCCGISCCNRGIVSGVINELSDYMNITDLYQETNNVNFPTWTELISDTNITSSDLPSLLKKMYVKEWINTRARCSAPFIVFEPQDGGKTYPTYDINAISSTIETLSVYGISFTLTNSPFGKDGSILDLLDILPNQYEITQVEMVIVHADATTGFIHDFLEYTVSDVLHVESVAGGFDLRYVLLKPRRYIYYDGDSGNMINPIFEDGKYDLDSSTFSKLEFLHLHFPTTRNIPFLLDGKFTISHSERTVDSTDPYKKLKYISIKNGNINEFNQELALTMDLLYLHLDNVGISTMPDITHMKNLRRLKINHLFLDADIHLLPVNEPTLIELDLSDSSFTGILWDGFDPICSRHISEFSVLILTDLINVDNCSLFKN